MRTLLLGLLLGAAAGVLYAPASGKKTRALLKDEMTILVNSTADAIENRTADLCNRLEGIKLSMAMAKAELQPQVERAAESTKQSCSQVRDTISDLGGSIKSTVQSTVDDIKSDKKRTA